MRRQRRKQFHDIYFTDRKNAPKRRRSAVDAAGASGGGSSAALTTTITTPSGDVRSIHVPLSERQQMALLMQMTADKSSQDPRQGHALAGAISSSSKRSQMNKKINKRNERGETPLHIAAIRGDVLQTKKLIKQGADVNSNDNAGWTPLHEAANHNHVKVAKVLVKAGANCLALSMENDTPLHDAVANHNQPLIKLLMKRGADPYQKNKKGDSPMDMASSSSGVETEKQLLLREEWSSDEESDLELPTSPESASSLGLHGDEAGEGQVFLAAGISGGGGGVGPVSAVSSSSGGGGGDASPVAQGRRVVAALPGMSTGYRASLPVSSSTPSAGPVGPPMGGVGPRVTLKLHQNRLVSAGSGDAAPGDSGGPSHKPERQEAGTPPTTTTDINPDSQHSRDSNLSTGDRGNQPKVPPLKIIIPSKSSAPSSTTINENDSLKQIMSAKHSLPYVVSATDGGSPKSHNSGDSNDGSKAGSGEGAMARLTRSRAALTSTEGDDSKDGEDKLGKYNVIVNEADSVSKYLKIRESVGSKACDSAGLGGGSGEVGTTTATVGDDEGAAVAKADADAREDISEVDTTTTAPPMTAAAAANTSSSSEKPMNTYALYCDIRRNVAIRRERDHIPIQCKAPYGFKNYLLQKRTYMLEGKTQSRLSVPMHSPPHTVTGPLRDLFVEQEKVRYKLRIKNCVEREKLRLQAECEMLRAQTRAARVQANQQVPFSLCTYMKDDEFYNNIEPDQVLQNDTKERSSSRSRLNGRQFLSWSEEVKDSFEKTKEFLLLRQHNEAESLYAVQKMVWEGKMKELGLCDAKATPIIHDIHVPMVHVSDELELLPT